MSTWLARIIMYQLEAGGRKWTGDVVVGGGRRRREEVSVIISPPFGYCSSSQSPTSSGPLIPRGQTLGTGSSMPPRAESRMYKPRGIDGGIRQ